MNTHPIFTAAVPLVLASASPRRQELLGRLGLTFTIEASTIEEEPPSPGQSPTEYAEGLAVRKAEDVARAHPGTAVIGADTVVALGDEILGKPADEADALRMLALLSGRTHEVVTGCCVLLPGGEGVTYSGRTAVRMRASGKAELRAYVATGEPMDKAGAYAIQGIGAFLVEHVEGSYTNVVGLPLARVLEVLLECGAVSPRCSD